MNDRAIPCILHQTWKNETLPRAFAKFRRTWLERHPDWEHRLWTDDENRALISQHYAWFMPIYNGYAEKIMQVDAVRYFILHRFGGVYADLDLECLRPIDPLLEGKRLVIGCEPPGHLAQHDVKSRGDSGRILCNAFMASVPAHPFWEHVACILPSCSDSRDPLSATGPFFLTSACETYANQSDISIEPHELLYPLSKKAFGVRRFARGARELPRDAYAVHHWSGSWWSPAYSPKSLARGVVNRIKRIAAAVLARAKPWLRRAYVLARPGEAFRYLLYLNAGLSPRISSTISLEKPGQVWVSRVSDGDCVARALVDIASARGLAEKVGYPLLSCLLVTRERAKLARRSIECFRRQTYPNLELVVIDDGPDDTLERWAASLEDPQIRYLRLADEGKPLGELREMSMQAMRGEYVAQWDDDDISHPDRLMLQMLALFAVSADASFLHQQILWQPDRRRLGVSERGLLENTIVVKKDRFGKYSSVAKGEDTPLCHELIKGANVALCDKPDLYIYVFHGANTWDEDHFDRIWEKAAVRHGAGEYDPVLNNLQQSFGIVLDERAQALATAGKRSGSAKPPLSPTSETPRVLVLVPVKNGMPHLLQFKQNLDNASYPKDKLSLAFLESDSDDGSYEELERMLPELRERYTRVELFKRDFGYRASRQRWEVSEQFVRRSTLAKSRNLLLSSALRDEQWVLWMDVDLLTWPADAIKQLLAAGEDIVVPYCTKPDGSAFDLNTFVLSEDAEQLDWSRYLCDGILQPPVGYGRHYLGEFSNEESVEVDGVGGTMLLVRADIHRQGLVFPVCSYGGYIETEGLAKMAKDIGYRPCGLPGLVIVHS